MFAGSVVAGWRRKSEERKRTKMRGCEEVGTYRKVIGRKNRRYGPSGEITFRCWVQCINVTRTNAAPKEVPQTPEMRENRQLVLKQQGLYEDEV